MAFAAGRFVHSRIAMSCFVEWCSMRRTTTTIPATMPFCDTQTAGDCRRRMTLPVPVVSLERRDLALTVGTHGRAGSLNNLVSQCGCFGLAEGEARKEIE